MYGKLTQIEESIIYLIGKGLKNEEIAKNLGKSKSTIGVYIYHLCRQNGAKNRIELYNKMKRRLSWKN